MELSIGVKQDFGKARGVKEKLRNKLNRRIMKFPRHETENNNIIVV